MKTRIIFIVSLIFLVINFSYAQEGLQVLQKTAFGKWENFGRSEKVEISENEIKFSDIEIMKYRFDRNSIYLEVDGDKISCAYRLADKDTLVVSIEGGDCVFKKLNNDNFTMSCDGEIFYFVRINSPAVQGGLQSLQKTAIGKWEVVDENEIIEISENEIRFSGDIMKYRFDRNGIYLEADGDKISCAYRLIDKDTFIVSFEGDNCVFKKLNNDNFTMSFERDTIHFRRSNSQKRP